MIGQDKGGTGRRANWVAGSFWSCVRHKKGWPTLWTDQPYARLEVDNQTEFQGDLYNGWVINIAEPASGAFTLGFLSSNAQHGSPPGTGRGRGSHRDLNFTRKELVMYVGRKMT